MKWRSPIITIVLVLAVPACVRSQLAETAAREREEYAVYSAIIPEIYHQEEGGILVIANPTGRYSEQIEKKDLRFMFPTPVVLQETLDDFIQRNKTNRWLTRNFK